MSRIKDMLLDRGISRSIEKIGRGKILKHKSTKMVEILVGVWTKCYSKWQNYFTEETLVSKIS